MSNITANQHYVWQYYLRAWAAPQQIWCKRIDQPDPFRTTPRNVASSRFFYEFYELTPADLDYLEGIIIKSNDKRLQETNRKWVEIFQTTFIIRKVLGGQTIASEYHDQLKTMLREIEKTMGEMFHGDIEKHAIPIINSLRNRDVSFYSDEQASINFVNYLSHQYFRTANLRNKMNAIHNPLAHDVKRTWPIEAFIYATNLAASFARQRIMYRIVLLRNNSDVSFITGDQPVINLCGPDDEEVDLYYPLKPDLAMIVTAKRSTYKKDEIDIGRLEVQHYNYKIFVKSDTQIFGNDPSHLKAVAQRPKA